MALDRRLKRGISLGVFNKSGKLFAPVNQLASAWSMLGPKFSAVQSANSDTQYSVSWYDVTQEPYVLHNVIPGVVKSK